MYILNIIQVVFQINTKHIGAISQVYPRFIIAIGIFFYIINFIIN